ncbi:HAD-like protein [Lipomyces japonicus]|uniref:HAD-like protein n=1 Tax=Lipomyces japonicus TaxID=56871 RepID=UPI0034CE071C
MTQSLEIETDAILFDLDGTLIDSTEAVIAHWTRFANQIGIAPEVILKTSHGRRSIDVISELAPSLASPEFAAALESRIPEDFGDQGKLIPGANELVRKIDAVNHELHDLYRGRQRWGVVTSGTSGMARMWLQILNVPTPDVFVTAELVKQGKPDPEGYLLGRKLLSASSVDGNNNNNDDDHDDGIKGSKLRTIVFEDAPAGVRAGKQAGCIVIGLATTHDARQVRDAGADFVVDNLLAIEIDDRGPKQGFVVRILNQAE